MLKVMPIFRPVASVIEPLAALWGKIMCIFLASILLRGASDALDPREGARNGLPPSSSKMLGVAESARGGGMSYSCGVYGDILYDTFR